MAAVAATLSAPVSFRVETPQDGRRHRLSVLGLDAARLAALRQGRAAAMAQALAVYAGGRLSAEETPAVIGNHVVDEEGLHFLPRFPFVAGIVYTARLAIGDVRIEHSFEVAPPARVDAPRVAAVYPSGETLPQNTLRLYVHFTQPMNAKDVHTRLRLLDDGGATVDLPFVEVDGGLWDPSQRRLTLVFHPGRIKRGIAPGERMGPPLEAGREYRLILEAGLTDAGGMPLGRAHEHRFRVGEPDREPPRLDRLHLEPPAAPGAPVALFLPEPLDHGLLQRWVWVEGEGGARVEGDIEVTAGETRWILRPRAPWAPGRYAVRVLPALEDRAGNRFDRPFDRDAAASPAPAATEPITLPFEVRP